MPTKPQKLEGGSGEALPSQPNELSRMLPRHFKILDLALEGLSNKQIAEEVGMSAQGISLVVNSPIFQDELARRRANREKAQDEFAGSTVDMARKRIEQSADLAARTHVELLDCPDPSIKQRSATYILDRCLGKSSESSVTPSLIIQADKLETLQIALMESRESRESREKPRKEAEPEK